MLTNDAGGARTRTTIALWITPEAGGYEAKL